MNENLDLTEILKDCPKGTKLYSTIMGEVVLEKINDNKEYPIIVKTEDNFFYKFSVDGKINISYKGECARGECTLFPSKYQRDWSKFKVKKPKKPKFDPKTLQPFDKVLVRDDHNQKWECSLFSYINIIDDIYYPYFTIINTGYKYCIPYNDDTKHLVGTNEEAPKFYRYWEE